MVGSTGTGEAVLVPSNYAPSCVACLRSLKRKGVYTIASSEQKPNPAFRSRYCDESISIPVSPHEDLVEYKDHLLSIAARPAVRTIVPIREEDSYLLGRYRSEFDEHVSLPFPSFETLKKVHDRYRLVEQAQKAGVSVPKTELLDEVTDWSRELIAKARYGVLTDEYVESFSPQDCVKVRSTEYLPPDADSAPDSIVEEMHHVPIVQEYISGDGSEYSFRAIFDEGEPVATCTKRQLRGDSYAGGISAYRLPVRVPEITEQSLALLKHLDWHGPCSVQFIQDEESGEYKLTEINPRFWGSLSMDTKAGVDFSYYYWLLANGHDVYPQTEYKTGIGTHHFANELLYLRSVVKDDFPLAERPSFPSAVWAVLFSFVTEPNFDYLRFDDPYPFIQDLAHTVKR